MYLSMRRMIPTSIWRPVVIENSLNKHSFAYGCFSLLKITYACRTVDASRTRESARSACAIGFCFDEFIVSKFRNEALSANSISSASKSASDALVFFIWVISNCSEHVISLVRHL